MGYDEGQYEGFDDRVVTISKGSLGTIISVPCICRTEINDTYEMKPAGLPNVLSRGRGNSLHVDLAGSSIASVWSWVTHTCQLGASTWHSGRQMSN